MGLSLLEESLRTQMLLSQLKLLLRQSVQHMLKTFNSTATTIDKVYSQVGVGRNGTTVPDDHYCWMRPEDMSYDRPVTTSSTAPDLGGKMAAALAAASIVFRDDTAYSKKLTTGAQRSTNLPAAWAGVRLTPVESLTLHSSTIQRAIGMSTCRARHGCTMQLETTATIMSFFVYRLLMNDFIFLLKLLLLFSIKMLLFSC